MDFNQNDADIENYIESASSWMRAVQRDKLIMTQQLAAMQEQLKSMAVMCDSKLNEAYAKVAHSKEMLTQLRQLNLDQRSVPTVALTDQNSQTNLQLPDPPLPARFSQCRNSCSFNIPTGQASTPMLSTVTCPAERPKKSSGFISSLARTLEVSSSIPPQAGPSGAAAAPSSPSLLPRPTTVRSKVTKDVKPKISKMAVVKTKPTVRQAQLVAAQFQGLLVRHLLECDVIQNTIFEIREVEKELQGFDNDDQEQSGASGGFDLKTHFQNNLRKKKEQLITIFNLPLANRLSLLKKQREVVAMRRTSGNRSAKFNLTAWLETLPSTSILYSTPGSHTTVIRRPPPVMHTPVMVPIAERRQSSVDSYQTAPSATPMIRSRNMKTPRNVASVAPLGTLSASSSRRQSTESPGGASVASTVIVNVKKRAGPTPEAKPKVKQSRGHAAASTASVPTARPAPPSSRARNTSSQLPVASTSAAARQPAAAAAPQNARGRINKAVSSVSAVNLRATRSQAKKR